jgi:DNA mismatch endonuclease (patch repair protein)
MDVFTIEKRSRIMSKIKSKDTKIEVITRKYLFAHGFRYRKNYKKLPGTPDIVLPKYKTAIFINGCFWHGHQGCKYFSIPKSRTDFWINKINKNIQRDKKNIQCLQNMGWSVIVIWGCELKVKNPEKRLNRLIGEIKFNIIK